MPDPLVPTKPRPARSAPARPGPARPFLPHWWGQTFQTREADRAYAARDLALADQAGRVFEFARRTSRRQASCGEGRP